MPENTCEFVVGRLLEIRVAAGYRSVDDVSSMIAMIRTQVGKLGSEDHFAIVADWRPVQIMSQETALRASDMLANVNPRVTRSGILTLPESPITHLQVVRLIREAQNARRRHFTSPVELYGWLSEVLAPEEVQRLRVFLGLLP